MRTLTERGITVGGEAVADTAPADPVELAAIESAPLTDVVGEMLANSDNNTAELLVKELGFADAGTGTREAGLAVIARTLAEWSIDTAPMVLADGSGLSLDNRVTCTVLLSVLQRSSLDGPIGAGLPIAGQTGTLSEIFVDHPIAGRLRARPARSTTRRSTRIRRRQGAGRLRRGRRRRGGSSMRWS